MMTDYQEYWTEHQRQEEAKAALSDEQRDRLQLLLHQRQIEFIKNKWGNYVALIALVALGGITLPIGLMIAVGMMMYPLAALCTGTLVNRDEFHRIQGECILEISGV